MQFCSYYFCYYKIVRNILEYDGVIMITIVVIAIRLKEFFWGVVLLLWLLFVTRLQETSILKCDVAIQYNMRLLSESAKLPFSFLDNLQM
jgi:hypothetical protein